MGSCDWPRLMDHWWASGQKEDRIYGCEQKNKKEGKAAPALSPPPPPPPALAKGEETELRCYAERYPDLLAGFCGGDAVVHAKCASTQHTWTRASCARNAQRIHTVERKGRLRAHGAIGDVLHPGETLEDAFVRVVQR